MCVTSSSACSLEAVTSGASVPTTAPANQLKRWLHARFVADRLAAAGVRAGMEFTVASVDVTHKALQAALDEAGPLELEAPGTIKAFQINITINTD